MSPVPVQLDSIQLPDGYRHPRQLVRGADRAAIDGEIDGVGTQHPSTVGATSRGYRTIQQLDGVGPTLGAMFVVEIGDVDSVPEAPNTLCSWAGLTPKHRESDRKVPQGKVTKAGSKLVRWAAIEAVSKVRGGPKLQGGLPPHRGTAGPKNVARIAVARKLLTMVYYGLRDGQLRCLAPSRGGMSPDRHSPGPSSWNGMTPTPVATSRK